MALVYLNRITTANNMALTNQNWRLLWLLAVMVAQKVGSVCVVPDDTASSDYAVLFIVIIQVWAHKPVRSGGFCRFYEDLRKSVLKRTEMSMMTMLDYNTGEAMY